MKGTGQGGGGLNTKIAKQGRYNSQGTEKHSTSRRRNK